MKEFYSRASGRNDRSLRRLRSLDHTRADWNSLEEAVQNMCGGRSTNCGRRAHLRVLRIRPAMLVPCEPCRKCLRDTRLNANPRCPCRNLLQRGISHHSATKMHCVAVVQIHKNFNKLVRVLQAQDDVLSVSSYNSANGFERLLSQQFSLKSRLKSLLM